MKSSGEVAGSPLPQDHSYRSRVAQHALFVGSSGHVKPDPSEPAQSSNTALQSDSSQESVQPKSAYLPPDSLGYQGTGLL